MSFEELNRPSQALRHYYVAVGTEEQKLPTLRNLLHALRLQEPDLSMIIVCNSRDTLDELVCTLSKLNYDCDVLHSDMHSGWRQSVLDNFNASRSRPDPIQDDSERAETAAAPTQSNLKILVSSDVCLPKPSAEELKRNVTMLINYDIPTRKDQHLKRLSCVSGSKGIFIHILVANEVGMLKPLETFTSQTIEEMPLILSDIFQGGPTTSEGTPQE
jgi:superfamily II DNA/RNA helicase